jgi:hypothetical protein
MGHKDRHKKGGGGDGALWVFIFVVIIFIGFWLLISYVVPLHLTRLHPFDVDAASTMSTEGQPFVFRLRRFQPSAKRGRPQLCTTGEAWNYTLGMCEPSPTDGFDPVLIDPARSPCKSFFNSSCGIWNSRHTNEDRTFSYSFHRTKHVLDGIVKSAPAGNPLSEFFQSCLVMHHPDEYQVEIKHLLDVILAPVKSYADLPQAFGHLAALGYLTPFTLSIERHPTEPKLVPLLTADQFHFSDRTITWVFERGRALTHDPIHFAADKIRRTRKTLEVLRQHNTEPIEDIVDYEHYIVNGLHEDMGKLPEWAGWTAFWDALRPGLRISTRSTSVWVVGRPYFSWLFGNEAHKDVEINDWKALIEFSILYHADRFMPDFESNLRLSESVHPPQLQHLVTGVLSHRMRKSPKEDLVVNEAVCLGLTQFALPGLIGKHYPLPHENVVEARKLVENIRDAYRTTLNQSSWLNSQDKATAQGKLDGLVIRVADPENWAPEPFSTELSRFRYAHNINLVRALRVQRNLDLWNPEEGFNRTKLARSVTPAFAANAYYSATSNSITLLPGILERPFFDAPFDQIARYAILGSIIGHEMGHMLDVHGVKWDKDGSYKSTGIWSAEGARVFAERLAWVKEEFAVAPEACTSRGYGEQTLGEDMADLLGVKLSLDALKQKEGEKVDTKRFFRSFAQTWCSSYDLVHRCTSVSQDVHAIPEYRVDKTLRNTAAFRQAFGCPAGSEMVHDPLREIY